MNPKEALERLREGNRQFAAGVLDSQLGSLVRREELTSGQAPIATIVSCSDSRVPSEFVFNQGLGDLFVIRVAGNVDAPAVVASAEFGVANLNIPLLIVVGHSNCGAVQAAIAHVKSDAEGVQNLAAILDHIAPVARDAYATYSSKNKYSLEETVERKNVQNVVNVLKTQSEVIAAAIQNQDVLVVGAHYSLETGVVDFFDGDTAD